MFSLPWKPLSCPSWVPVSRTRRLLPTSPAPRIHSFILSIDTRAYYMSGPVMEQLIATFADVLRPMEEKKMNNKQVVANVIRSTRGWRASWLSGVRACSASMRTGVQLPSTHLK